MHKVRVLIPLIAIILLISCAQITITGSGNVITREEAITSFDKVDISHSFNVQIEQGENFRVLIRVDDNLVEHLNVVKQGSTLKIYLKPNRAYNIINATMAAEITMPELVGLELSGSSDASISGFDSSNSLVVDLSGNSTLLGNIQAGDTRFDLSGNSSVTITGSAGDLTVDASGSSEADLTEFPAINANVEASGASTVIVNLSGRLDADASGSSNIYYLGDPTMGELDMSGSSTIQSR